MLKTRDFRVPLALALVSSQILQPASTIQSRENPQVARSLTEEQKIVHVLNRAGFGPRPGDA